MKRIMKQQLLIALLFAGTAIHAQNIYGDMENWRNVYPSFGTPASFESPLGWYDTDSLIFMARYYFPNAVFSKQAYKTSDAHSGNYAVKLLTLYQDTFGMMSGLLSNGFPVADSLLGDPAVLVGGTHFYGGTLLSQRVDSLNAWIKYFPNGADTAVIAVKAVLTGQAVNGEDSIIGNGVLMLSQNYSSYTLISVPINYINSAIPDKIFVFFASSHKAPKDSSALYVDDVSISQTTGVNMPGNAVAAIEIYPNPTSGMIYINAGKEQEYYIDIYNSLGQLMRSQKINGKAAIDLSSEARGIYFYCIMSQQKEVVRTGKVNIMR